MHGFNLLAILLIALAGVLAWLAWSGNYKTTGAALQRKYQGGSQIQ